MTTEPITQPEQKPRRRWAVGALLLATVVAVGGGSAYLIQGLIPGETSAAFQDTSKFKADVSVAKVNLLASVDGGQTFSHASTDEDALDFGVGGLFTDLTPGETREAPVQIKNAGTVPVLVTSALASTTGNFMPFSVTPQLTGVTTGDELAAGEVREITVKVSLPANADDSTQGTSGSVKVQIDAENK